MEAGKLRDSITIKEQSGTPNAYREKTTWSDVFTTRASVEQLQGRELFMAEEAKSEISIKFRIRYRSDLENSHRVLHRGTLYRIVSAVNVDGLNKELLLYCKVVK